MKLKLPLLSLVLLVFFQPVLAATPTDTIRDYIRITYGDRLIISNAQIEQLSWVLDNPVATPEMETVGISKNIHREVPRTLSRLYCLQLLRSGKNEDYHQFIAPQVDEGTPKLNKDSFNALSKRIASLDDESYRTLETTAVISAVTLSVKARTKAAKVLTEPLPEDSVQFLSVTAQKADKIYPLAKQLITKYPDARYKIEAAFLPDSHLRHMMYNEGSLDMYSTIKAQIGNGRLTLDDLNLWYDHWMINIAGFRGHLAPLGSLYLSQRTYMAMHQVKLALDKMAKDRKINPMVLYLQKRANWLYLNNWTKSPQERVALASLAALLRLFTTQDGSVLFHSFRKLSATDQRRWITYAEGQLTVQNRPAPTYGPALLGNAVGMADLSEAIIKVVPVMLESLELVNKLRIAGVLKVNVPLSFREMARESTISRILNASKPLVVDINPDNGIATIK